MVIYISIYILYYYDYYVFMFIHVGILGEPRVCV